MPEKSVESPIIVIADAGVKTSGVTANLSTDGQESQPAPSVETVPVSLVEPLRSGSVKSILATPGAVLAIFGLSYTDVGMIARNAATSGQAPLVLIVIAVLVAVVVVYWKYLDRQTKLDLLRETHAHELNVQQIDTASDPSRNTVSLNQNDKSIT